jgi:predicted DNA-binding transcriptional regulator AlpA
MNEINPEMANEDSALLLTSRQAARACGMSRSSWYKLYSTGKVPRPVKIGKLARWRREELRDWVKAGCPRRDHWVILQGKNKT